MYLYKNNHTYHQDDSDGEITTLCNFTAQIIREVRYISGSDAPPEIHVTVSGIVADPADAEKGYPLPEITLSAEEFTSMSWVMRSWGTRCIIRPGSGIKDDLRTAIQQNSQPTVELVYKHTGWATIGKTRAFIHAGGAITSKGNNTSVRTSLPHELRLFNLAYTGDIKQSVLATFDLLDVAPRSVTWPLLACYLLPLHEGCADFACHTTGRTGTYKSELSSLFQSHFGAAMDARKLPANWSSTANSLEALAFYAKDVPLVVDDFVPTGTAYQQRSYHQSAERLIRAQGNQAGRGRLSDTSTQQVTMYPRGMVCSTGEETYDGHSIRARSMLLELSPGDVDLAALTKAQGNRHLYPGTVAGYVQHLAGRPFDLKKCAEEIRANYMDTGHSRTPNMLSRLVATIAHFLDWCTSIKAIDARSKNALFADAEKSIREAGLKQASFLENVDPIDVFKATLLQVVQSGLGHFRTINDGTPAAAELLGWSKEQGESDLPYYKARGPVLGWVSMKKEELYLEINVGLSKVLTASRGEIALSKPTLLKRMKESGLLKRVDEVRNRNTIRIMAGGGQRQVACMDINQIIDLSKAEADDGGDEL